jgi:hypothetical protein
MADRAANLQQVGSKFDPPAIQARFDNAGDVTGKLKILSDLGKVAQTNRMTTNPQMWQDAILAKAKTLPTTPDQRGLIGGEQIKQAIAYYFKLISSQPNPYDTKAYPKWQQEVQAYGFNPPGIGGTIVSIPKGEPKAAPGVLPPRKAAPAAPQSRSTGRAGGTDPYGVLPR